MKKLMQMSAEATSAAVAGYLRHVRGERGELVRFEAGDDGRPVAVVSVEVPDAKAKELS